MTKDEIFNKHSFSAIGAISPSKDFCLKAMDEHAKQFGEKLIGWLNDNDFKPSSFKDNMQSDYVNNGEKMHASEIVDLFIEQQNKE